MHHISTCEHHGLPGHLLTGAAQSENDDRRGLMSTTVDAPGLAEQALETIRTKAVVCYEGGQPWELTELELDPPKANEVRVKWYAAGLCHSDDHIQKGDAPMRMPVVGGHEGAGVVDAVGPGVTRVELGTTLWRPSSRRAATAATAPPVSRICATTARTPGSAFSRTTPSVFTKTEWTTAGCVCSAPSLSSRWSLRPL